VLIVNVLSLLAWTSPRAVAAALPLLTPAQACWQVNGLQQCVLCCTRVSVRSICVSVYGNFNIPGLVWTSLPVTAAALLLLTPAQVCWQVNAGRNLCFAVIQCVVDWASAQQTLYAV
jgi:hypothetical protein